MVEGEKGTIFSKNMILAASNSLAIRNIQNNLTLGNLFSHPQVLTPYINNHATFIFCFLVGKLKPHPLAQKIHRRKVLLPYSIILPIIIRPIYMFVPQEYNCSWVKLNHIPPRKQNIQVKRGEIN